MRTMTFRVTGLVQHVWFRGWTQMTAEALGLAGWVRNLPDGSVAGQVQAGQAQASQVQASQVQGSGDDEGSDALLERFRLLLHQGPPSARVARVEAEFTDLAEHFSGFTVRR